MQFLLKMNRNQLLLCLMTFGIAYPAIKMIESSEKIRVRRLAEQEKLAKEAALKRKKEEEERLHRARKEAIRCWFRLKTIGYLLDSEKRVYMSQEYIIYNHRHSYMDMEKIFEGCVTLEDMMKKIPDNTKFDHRFDKICSNFVRSIYDDKLYYAAMHYHFKITSEQVEDILSSTQARSFEKLHRIPFTIQRKRLFSYEWYDRFYI